MKYTHTIDDPINHERPTINPYRYAAALVAGRLIWDVNPKSWLSRARLNSIKNTRKNQKAVIVCNGPSLLKVELNQIANVFTLGLNKINLIFDKTSWRPSCIVAINKHVLEQNQTFYNDTEIPLFLNSRSASSIKLRKNVTFIHCSPQHKLARDCAISINEGYTVTVAALQLAFHMGFKSVALIGCDHNFAQKGPANATVTAGENDPSHFDPKYFSNGVKWQLPDLECSEHYYLMARNVFEASGREIVNSTEGGKLEVFRRKPLGDWLNS
jgi:hypothetical protein